MRALAFVIAWLVLGSPGAASAQCPAAPDPGADRCQATAVDFRHVTSFLPSISLDSGWVPAGSPIQVHFAFLAMAETEVDLGGNAVGTWPTTPAGDIAVSIPGRRGTGRLAMAYGFQVIAEMRLHLVVAGSTYDWTGDIPLPASIPTDLRVAATTTFDPFVLPGTTPRPVIATDSTSPIRVAGLSISSLVGGSIPGIDGGIDVNILGTLTTSYQTNRLEVVRGMGYVTAEGMGVPVPPLDGLRGWGPNTDVFVLPRGTIGYDGVITVTPAVYVTLLGRRWDLVSFDIPLHVVSTTTDTMFNTARAHLPLPDVQLSAASIDVGDVAVGESGQGMTTVQNDGDAELVVTVGATSAGLAVMPSTMRLAAHSTRAMVVTFTPTMGGSLDDTIPLTTNDPDHPALTVAVTGSAHVPPMPDAGPLDAGPRDGGSDGGHVGYTTPPGCGCSVASRPAPTLALLALGLALAARRRRRAQR